MTRSDASASAVLFSGGLDSTVLLAAELTQAGEVWPIYVRTGLAWEAGEAEAMAHLLAAPPFAGRLNRLTGPDPGRLNRLTGPDLGRLNPLTAIDVDMRDVYPRDHWAVIGRPPAFDTPDEDVFLEGRNVVLIGKASVLCGRLGVSRLVLGPLAGNPFPDATPEFFTAMARALSLGLDRSFEIATPLATQQKSDVVRLGLELGVPLEATLSCMNPSGGRHCGVCSKCRERRDAFRAAGVVDGTVYATAPAR